VTDENVEPLDQRDDRDESDEEKRRAGWLPWIVLAIAVVVVLWLFWRYAQPPSLPADGGTGAVLTAANVPNVVGMSQGAAVDAIKKSGFIAEKDSAFNSDSEPGLVVSQAPPAGTKLTKGGPVVIVVAVDVGEATGVPEGMEDDVSRVPNVVGMTELRANELLNNSGYNAYISSGYSRSRPRGIVYEQSPVAGESAGYGATVEAVVSLGPAPPGKAQVPNVVGTPVKQAVRELEDAGFDARSMVQYHPEYSKVVFQQNPAAGELAPVGSRVFILSGD
jgi:beta-lactam-binding protein with PASTA domain